MKAVTTAENSAAYDVSALYVSREASTDEYEERIDAAVPGPEDAAVLVCRSLLVELPYRSLAIHFVTETVWDPSAC